MLDQRLAAVLVEGRREVDSRIGRQRAEARVEMVIAVVDELQGNRRTADLRGQPLQSAGVAANQVAAEQRLAAKQGIAGAFEIPSLRKSAGFETMGAKPVVILRRLSLAG